MHKITAEPDGTLYSWSFDPKIGLDGATLLQPIIWHMCGIPNGNPVEMLLLNCDHVAMKRGPLPSSKWWGSSEKWLLLLSCYRGKVSCSQRRICLLRKKQLYICYIMFSAHFTRIHVTYSSLGQGGQCGSKNLIHRLSFSATALSTWPEVDRLELSLPVW